MLRIGKSVYAIGGGAYVSALALSAFERAAPEKKLVEVTSYASFGLISSPAWPVMLGVMMREKNYPLFNGEKILDTAARVLNN